jgi:hypothetical protein
LTLIVTLLARSAAGDVQAPGAKLGLALVAVLSHAVLAPPDVLGKGHWFEMVGVAARRDSAEVVELYVCWNFADEKFIDDSMDVTYALAVPCVSVPFWRFVPEPEPARSRGVEAGQQMLQSIVDQRWHDACFAAAAASRAISASRDRRFGYQKTRRPTPSTTAIPWRG